LSLDSIRTQLERILGSQAFPDAPSLSRLPRLVEHSLGNSGTVWNEPQN